MWKENKRMPSMTITLQNGNMLECCPKTENSPEQFKLPDQEQRKHELDLLVENAHFLLENKDIAFSDSRIFFAPVNVASGGAYIGTFVKPTLGTYIEWWLERGQDDLVVCVSGSPLSGANASSVATKDRKHERLKTDERYSNLVKQFNLFHGRYRKVREDCDSYTFEEAIAKMKDMIDESK